MDNIKGFSTVKFSAAKMYSSLFWGCVGRYLKSETLDGNFPETDHLTFCPSLSTLNYVHMYISVHVQVFNSFSIAFFSTRGGLLNYSNGKFHFRLKPLRRKFTKNFNPMSRMWCCQPDLVAHLV